MRMRRCVCVCVFVGGYALIIGRREVEVQRHSVVRDEGWGGHWGVGAFEGVWPVNLLASQPLCQSTSSARKLVAAPPFRAAGSLLEHFWIWGAIFSPIS